MSKIGYIRVSTNEQNTDRQESALNNLNLDKIFLEKISGKDINRPQLIEMMKYIREGDILYIESLSRLGRSTKDLIILVEQLNSKNVQLVSLKESIDTTTPSGKLMFNIFASLAEFERDIIKLRQREGIEAAKAKGKHLGRPRAEYPSNWVKTYNDWKANKIKAVEAMKELNIKKSTFYKLVKQFERK